MNIAKLFGLIIKFGKAADPRRDKKSISGYSDSAVIYGQADRPVEKILVGIDIDVADLLLADRIRQRQGLDLVLSHHPQGKAYAGLANVMKLQVQLLEDAGMDKIVADGFLKERQMEVARRILPANHMRGADAAKLLDMPFICSHTPADNQVYAYIKNMVEKLNPRSLKDVVDMLMDVPEYAQAAEYGAGPKILIGNPKRAVGKVLVEMTGGTEGHQNVYSRLHKSGIRTLISMHLSEEHLKKVCDANLNVVIAGHISSDTLGMNLLLDKIQQYDKDLNILSCSGFRRISRIKKAK